MYLKTIEKIEEINLRWHISKNEYELLKRKYQKKLDQENNEFKKLLKEDKDSEQLILKTLSLHALWIEKQYLKVLFRYNEIDEYVFKYMLGKIERQIERIESNKTQVKWETLTEELSFVDKVINYLHSKNDNTVYQYLKYRTKYIVSSKVIAEFESLKKINWGFNNESFDIVMELYKKFNTVSKQKVDEIYSKHEEKINLLNVRLVNKSLLKVEEKTIKNLYWKEFLTPKLYVDIIDDIEYKINRSVDVVI